MKNKYTELQDKMIEMMGLKVGDTVTVTHKVASKYLGWSCPWLDTSMDDYVGRQCKVLELCDEQGVLLREGKWNRLWFPIMVVSKVKSPDPDIIVGDYTVVFKDNGDLKVGCTDVPFALLKKIYTEAVSAKEAYNKN